MNLTRAFVTIECSNGQIKLTRTVSGVVDGALSGPEREFADTDQLRDIIETFRRGGALALAGMADVRDDPGA